MIALISYIDLRKRTSRKFTLAIDELSIALIVFNITRLVCPVSEAAFLALFAAEHERREGTLERI